MLIVVDGTRRQSLRRVLALSTGNPFLDSYVILAFSLQSGRSDDSLNLHTSRAKLLTIYRLHTIAHNLLTHLVIATSPAALPATLSNSFRNPWRCLYQTSVMKSRHHSRSSARGILCSFLRFLTKKMLLASNCIPTQAEALRRNIKQQQKGNSIARGYSSSDTDASESRCWNRQQGYV